MLKTVPVEALVSRGAKLGAVMEVQGSLSEFKRWFHTKEDRRAAEGMLGLSRTPGI